MRRKLLYAVVILIYLAGFAAAAAPDLNRLAAAISASDVIGDFEERARGDPEDGQDTGAEDGTGEDAWDPGLSEELRRAMEEYNARIFAEGQSGMTDPWVYEQSGVELADYGVEDDVAAVIEIPSMSVELPVYLGATEDNMTKGAVHLGETSMPTGGENTNCVIAAHRGYRGIPMFQYIEDVQVGDPVILTNLWETLVYRVSEIKVIDPSDIREILIRPGEDMVTLFTCHPYTHNYQRYIVLCTRDPGAEAAYAAGKDIENGTASAEYAADQGVSSDVRNAAIEDDGEILRRERLLRYGSYAALAAAGVAILAGMSGKKGKRKKRR